VNDGDLSACCSSQPDVAGGDWLVAAYVSLSSGRARSHAINKLSASSPKARPSGRPVWVELAQHVVARMRAIGRELHPEEEPA